jgi:hypothetical protein
VTIRKETLMELSQADEVITAAEWADDVETLSPSRIRVGALDLMHGVTPEMLDWWFAHMERDTYLAFHPIDHRDFAWVRGKQADRYVGATHLTHQRYGGEGPLMRAEISFVAPEELLDTSKFAERQVGVAICAVVHLLDDGGQPQAEEAGRFIHIGLRRDYGTELRSSWWLNVNEESDIEWLTERRLQHVHQEFAYLEGFLPELYEHGHRPVASSR